MKFSEQDGKYLCCRQNSKRSNCIPPQLQGIFLFEVAFCRLYNAYVISRDYFVNLTIEQFLKDIEYQMRSSWTHSFNMQNALERSLSLLIYCAKNNVKTYYAGLAKYAGLPIEYQQGAVLGIVVGEILKLLGKYCAGFDADMPKITSLCVRYITGYAGNGFKEFWEDYDKKTYTEKKRILINEYQKLREFNFDTVIKINNIKLPELVDYEVMAQDRFWEPKSERELEEKIEEAEIEDKTSDSESKEIRYEFRKGLYGKEKRFEQDTEWKNRFAWFVICFVSVWSFCVIAIIVFNSLHILDSQIPISDNVMIVLLTTTFGNVLGLAWLVTSHLFPRLPKNNNKE